MDLFGVWVLLRVVFSFAVLGLLVVCIACVLGMGICGLVYCADSWLVVYGLLVVCLCCVDFVLRCVAFGLG